MASRHLKESLSELNESLSPDYDQGAGAQAARGGCDFEASRLYRGPPARFSLSSFIILVEEAQPSPFTRVETSRHSCCAESQRTPVLPSIRTFGPQLRFSNATDLSAIVPRTGGLAETFPAILQRAGKNAMFAADEFFSDSTHRR